MSNINGDSKLKDHTTAELAAYFGVDMAIGADEGRTHQLTIDELPKHSNSLEPHNTAYLLPPQPEPKPWYASKTIWFNLIIAAMTMATAATPSLEPLMTPEVYGVLATGVAFINAILRLVTGKPIKGSEKAGGNG